MKENKRESIGVYLRRIRNEKEISINELVKKSGVSKGYISQIENNKFTPSLDIVRKISNALKSDFYEAAWRAGLITDDEIEDARNQKKFFDSMTLEDHMEREKQQAMHFQKNWNIKQYQEKMHTRIEDFLKDERRSFYIDDHKLTHEEIRMLITLYGGKEKNYPSDEQIQKEYEEIKKTKEVNKRKVKDGEAFFILDPYDDIDTSEDIKGIINDNKEGE